jgi:hypothetical protein
MCNETRARGSSLVFVITFHRSYVQRNTKDLQSLVFLEILGVTKYEGIAIPRIFENTKYEGRGIDYFYYMCI